MKVQYIRVSTFEQKTDRQEIVMGAKVYQDKCSGSISFKDRPEAKKLVHAVQGGDVTEMHIHSIDRLGRNTLDIMSTIQWLTSFGVNVISKKEGLRTLNDDGVTENPLAKLMVGILGTLAEFELSRIKERQREGIEKAKERGAYKLNGRPSGTIESESEFLQKKKSKMIAKRLELGHSLRDTAKLCSCSLATVQKVVKLVRAKEDAEMDDEYKPWFPED